MLDTFNLIINQMRSEVRALGAEELKTRSYVRGRVDNAVKNSRGTLF